MIDIPHPFFLLFRLSDLRVPKPLRSYLSPFHSNRGRQGRKFDPKNRRILHPLIHVAYLIFLYNIRQHQLDHGRCKEAARASVPAMPKCEEMIVNGDHGLFLQLDEVVQVISFGVGLERSACLAVARKTERVVHVRVWVKFGVTMDRVRGKADLCTVRDMKLVPQVDAFRGDDLEERSWSISRPSWAWSQQRMGDLPDVGLLLPQVVTAAYFLFWKMRSQHAKSGWEGPKW